MFYNHHIIGDHYKFNQKIMQEHYVKKENKSLLSRIIFNFSYILACGVWVCVYVCGVFMCVLICVGTCAYACVETWGWHWMTTLIDLHRIYRGRVSWWIQLVLKNHVSAFHCGLTGWPYRWATMLTWLFWFAWLFSVCFLEIQTPILSIVW